MKLRGFISYDSKSDSLYFGIKEAKYIESIDLNNIILDIGENDIIKLKIVINILKRNKLIERTTQIKNINDVSLPSKDLCVVC